MTNQPSFIEQPAPTLPPVLDTCCGSRMFWFDKKDPRALFVDKRCVNYAIKPDAAYPNGCTISVQPDRIDLGLAILSAVNQGRNIFNREDLAAWCECDPESIRLIELRTLRRVRELLKIKPGQRREDSPL